MTSSFSASESERSKAATNGNSAFEGFSSSSALSSPSKSVTASSTGNSSSISATVAPGLMSFIYTSCSAISIDIRIGAAAFSWTLPKIIS